jgi:hypothetical protein
MSLQIVSESKKHKGGVETCLGCNNDAYDTCIRGYLFLRPSPMPSVTSTIICPIFHVHVACPTGFTLE